MRADGSIAMALTAQPLFSIVIPTRNRAALLQRCLQSVLAQEYSDYEVIVVDDGSSDDTPEVLARFAPRVRALRQPGRGPSEARNFGVSKATGRFIVFLDSDDLLTPSALLLYASLIASSGAALLIAAFRSFVDEQELADDGRSEAPSMRRFATYLDAAADGHLSGTARLVIDRSVYVGANGLSTEFRVCEDQDFGLRINQAGPCLVITSPVTVGYRAHAGNLSKDIAEFGRGIQRIIRAEQRGLYPGGAERSTMRRQ